MKYVEQTYSFPGEWDVPSRCGLKIIRTPERHVVIVTELYEDNPGTSVTACAGLLAARIVEDFGLDQERLLYIEQSPDRGSKLDHYQESFDIVHLRRDGARFCDPEWERISAERMRELAGG